MAKFLNECMDSADWIEEISGYRPTDDVITLEQLSELSEKFPIDTVANHWDYPLSETSMLATDEDKADTEYVLVRFKELYGGYEYRWCEI